jgi:hypothetical protein
MAKPETQAAKAKKSDEDAPGSGTPPKTGLEAQEKPFTTSGAFPLPPGAGTVRVSVVVEVTTTAAGAQARASRSEDTQGGGEPPPKVGGLEAKE